MKLNDVARVSCALALMGANLAEAQGLAQAAKAEQERRAKISGRRASTPNVAPASEPERLSGPSADRAPGTVAIATAPEASAAVKADSGTTVSTPQQPPENPAVTAQIALARKYQWARAYSRGIVEFRKVLVMDPTNVEAQIGLGQCYAWSGDLATARETFERILIQEPGRREAEVALGYLELYADPWYAEQRSGRLASRFPGNDEVTAFRSATNKNRAPTVTANFDRVEDTGHTSSEKSKVEALFALPKVDLTVAAGRVDLEAGGTRAEARVDSAFALLEWRAGAGQRLSVRGGFDQVTGSKGAKQTVAVGGGTWEYGRARRVQARLSFDREAARMAPDVSDDGIVSNAISGTLGRQFGRLTLEGDLGFAKLTGNRPSLDNERTSAGLTARRRFTLGILPVFIGYGYRWMSYQKAYQNYFFSPDDYRGHRGFVMTYGQTSRFLFFAYAEIGAQKVVSGVGASRFESGYDKYISANAGVGFILAPGLRLSVTGVRNRNGFDSNAFGATGFGFSLRWMGAQNTK